tara:strand:+ start:101 stop:1063 length:963 start_codon:yes stop_codon:yes gene_type:complete
MNYNNVLKTSFKTAILLLVFNRVETTTKVFKKISQIRPAKLYVAGDGPREGNDKDKDKVQKVRDIVTRIDWPCDVKTLFREKNLGCKKSVSAAIKWFFEQEKQGIILEDDCVPHLDFFAFCDSLLDYYAEDERVSVITGNNFQNNKWRGDASYYFSKYNHCWGWASWRRSWKNYQGDIKFWSEWKRSKDWLNSMPDKAERKYWENIFKNVYSKKIDSWAYPWTASLWYKKGLTVTPNVNLVSNIGFGEDATHTKSENNKYFNMITGGIGNLTHPKKVSRDIEADMYVFNNFFGGKNMRFPENWIVILRRIVNYVLKNIKN